MRANETDKMDGLIDQALSSYMDATPLAGLEQRVWNRVREANAGRSRSTFFGLGLALASALVLVGILAVARRSLAPQISESAPAPIALSQTPASQGPDRGIRAAVATHAPRSRTIAKHRPVPTPARFSSAERTLLAFVQNYPREAQSLAADMKRNDEPIAIASIQIEPLESGSEQ